MTVPVLVSSARGHGYVTLAPLMTEALRVEALDQVRHALGSLPPGNQLPGLKLDIQSSWETESIIEAARRKWSVAELEHIRDFLETLGEAPLMEYSQGEGSRDPWRKVPIRMIARVKTWKNIAIENMTPDKDKGGPDGPSQEWPLPMAGTSPTTSKLMELWARRCAWVAAQTQDLAGYALNIFNANAGMGGDLLGGGRYPEPHLGRMKVFQGMNWKQAIRLADGLQQEHIREISKPSNPLEPFLNGAAVVVCLDRIDGEKSGFLDAKGLITFTLTSARLYSSVEEAQRSIKGQSRGFRGRFIQMERATFLQVGLQIQGLVPGTHPSGDLGSKIASWVRREALENLAPNGSLPERKQPKI